MIKVMGIQATQTAHGTAPNESWSEEQSLLMPNMKENMDVADVALDLAMQWRCEHREHRSGRMEGWMCSNAKRLNGFESVRMKTRLPQYYGPISGFPQPAETLSEKPLVRKDRYSLHITAHNCRYRTSCRLVMKNPDCWWENNLSMFIFHVSRISSSGNLTYWKSASYNSILLALNHWTIDIGFSHIFPCFSDEQRPFFRCRWKRRFCRTSWKKRKRNAGLPRLVEMSTLVPEWAELWW